MLAYCFQEEKPSYLPIFNKLKFLPICQYCKMGEFYILLVYSNLSVYQVPKNRRIEPRGPFAKQCCHHNYRGVPSPCRHRAATGSAILLLSSLPSSSQLSQVDRSQLLQATAAAQSTTFLHTLCCCLPKWMGHSTK